MNHKEKKAFIKREIADMTTAEKFIKINFQLLNDIMDRNFGVIECNSVINPNQEAFNQPINKNHEKSTNTISTYSNGIVQNALCNCL